MTKKRFSAARAQRRADSFAFELNALSREIDAALMRRAGGAALASLAALGLSFAPMPALADTFTVNSTLDPGDGTCDAAECTLREAIAAANANTGFDTVDASSVTGTINLNGTEIAITGNYGLEILGPGAAGLTVNAQGNFRVFNSTTGEELVIRGMTLANGSTTGDGGAVYGDYDVYLYDVIVTGSHADGDGGGVYAGDDVYMYGGSVVTNNTADGSGGGVYAYENVEADESTISNNTAGGSGGGAFSIDDMDLYGATVSGNTAGGAGGGLYADNEVFIDGTNISGNTASNGPGGGIYSSDDVYLEDSTVSNNQALGAFGYGGGIYAYNLEMEYSTLSGNDAGADGGGFRVRYVADIDHSTISGNRAGLDAGATYRVGGGGFAYEYINVSNSTISGNSAYNDGGGLYSLNSEVDLDYATVTLNAATNGNGGGVYADAVYVSNSIVANNSAGNAASVDIYEAGGTGINADYSLIGVYGGTITGGNNIVGSAGTPASANLGPLQNNGGSTYTHAIDNSSDAYNAGDATPATPPSYDQRGAPFPRVSGGQLDMGAFEYVYAPIPAGGLVVNDLGDPGLDGQCTVSECTLREAVLAANFNAGPNDITFDTALAGTIDLDAAEGEMAIFGDTTISGNLSAGVPAVTVDAQGNSRIFYIGEDVDNATIANLAFTNGYAAEDGGAIDSQAAHLTLDNLSFTNNVSDSSGGAVSAETYGGSITITESTFSGNSTPSEGGGLFVGMYGAGNSFTLTGSTFDGNIAEDGGGGLFLGMDGGVSASLQGNTFSANRAGGGGGGAAIYIKYGVQATLTGNTFSNNVAGVYYDGPSREQDGGHGGGLFAALNGDASLYLTAGNSFTGNQAYPNENPCGISYGAPRFEAGGMGGGLAIASGKYFSEGGPGGPAVITGAAFTGNIAHGGTYTPYCEGSTQPPVNAGGYGGGMYLFGGSGAEFRVDQSTITGNTAEITGGGVAIYGKYGSGSGPPQRNTLSPPATKGIGPPGPPGDAEPNYFTIADSTLAGNVANDGAGGLAAELKYNNHLEVVNSTISGNTGVDAGGVGLDDVGGPYGPGTASLRHLTVVENQATGGPGGIDANDQEVALANSIVYNPGVDLATSEGPGFNLSYSLIGDAGTAVINDLGGNLYGQDPALGPLQDNGGPTQTHALDLASPAFNAGDPGFAPPPSEDQRGDGFPRVALGQLDMGAYEFQGPIPVTLNINPDPAALNEDGSNSATISACLPTGVNSFENVAVTLSVGGAATPGTDHDLSDATVVTIPTGANCGDVVVTALQDTENEVDSESVSVSIGSLPTGYSAGSPSQVSATVVDDEVGPPPGPVVTVVTVGLSVVNIQEENPSAKLALKSGHTSEITVTLDAPAPGDVEITLGFSGVAQLGTDFTVTGNPVAIPQGASQGTATVTAIPDNEVEGDEPFTAFVQAATCTPNCSVQIPSPPPEANGVILDDDQALEDPAAPIPALGPLGLLLLPLLIPLAGWRYLRKRVWV